MCKKDLIKKGIIVLCEERQEFRNQGDIIKAKIYDSQENDLFGEVVNS